MADRSPNISVIIIIGTDYIKDRGDLIGFKKSVYLLLSRDVFKIIRLRKAENKGTERAFDVSSKYYKNSGIACGH